MNREEVSEILATVKAAAYKLDNPKLLEIIGCGSYRRGKPTCRDVDILMTRNDEKPTAGLLQKLVAE